MRSKPVVIAEAERLAQGSWSIESTARLEALLWVLGEVEDDQLSGPVEKDRLRDLSGSHYVGDEPDLSRLLPESD